MSSREDIEYGTYSFEENTFIITWLQLFLIKFLSEDENRLDWTDQLIKEWRANSAINIYKYVFDDRLLNTSEKIEWSKKFIDASIEKIDAMSMYEFSEYIDEAVGSIENYDHIKIALKKIKMMLDGKDPESYKE